jgi:hypothetical protein
MALSRITAASIEDGTVVAADIATGTITGDKIGVGQITANLFASGAVSTTSISNGNSNVSIASANSDVSIFTAGIEAMLIDSGQRTKFPTTIGVGGATPSTSGSGISFPATESASSDANTLDDYEEGTFTPVLQRDSTAMTVGLAQGFYTKIGRQVFIQLQVQDITDAGSTEELKFTGLPFAGSSSFDRQHGTLVFNRITKPANSVDGVAIIPGFQSAYTTLALYWNQTGNANFVAWAPNDLADPTGSDIAAAITYFVA